MTSTIAPGPAATAGLPVPGRRVGQALPVVLAMLTVFGPVSIDLYLPVLPALTDELGAAPSMPRLTVTACLLGLAFGQVVAGPSSDRFGRRAPLLVGVAAYVVTSLACAAGPTVEVLVAARFTQDLAGAVGIVIARAAGRDLHSGFDSVRPGSAAGGGAGHTGGATDEELTW